LTQVGRLVGAGVGLLLLGVVLSACGGTPVAQYWPGITLADDTVYVISGTPQKVYMLDAETGAQKGTFAPAGELRGVVWWSPVTVAEGLAFVGFTETGSGGGGLFGSGGGGPGKAGLYVFDPETGQELWNVPAEGQILPAPVYSDGAVYYGATDGSVYAVDVESQAVRPGWPFQADNAVWGSPLVVDDRVYVAAMDHHVYSLDAETGEEQWKVQLGGAIAAQPSLHVANGFLYVGTFDGKAYAIDANSGELVESFEFQSENWIWSEILADAEPLHVTSLDGKLYALDPASGAVVPPYPFDSSEIGNASDRIRAAPVPAGESIVVATENGFVIAVKDARRQWSWPGGTPQTAILTNPVVGQGKVYVVLQNGDVQSLDAETGVPGWSFSSPGDE
jgi:outer membrane protein assembly factor BamB